MEADRVSERPSSHEDIESVTTARTHFLHGLLHFHDGMNLGGKDFRGLARDDRER